MNWREDMLDTKQRLSKYKIELLKNGAKSLSQSWILNAYYQEWKRMKGIKPTPPPPNCQSSFKEWNNKVENADG